MSSAPNVRTDRPLSVGVLGVGAIGVGVLAALARGCAPGVALAGAAGRDPVRATEVLSEQGVEVPVFDRQELVRRSDLIVEAASAEVYPELLAEAAAWDTDVLALSCCGVAAHPRAVEACVARGRRVHVPSAAVAGLDALLAGSCGRLRSVRLEITRPWAGLEDTPLAMKLALDQDRLSGPREVFRGSPLAACRLMPGRVNIAVAVGLAAGVLDACEVVVVVRPAVTTHTHRVIAEGDFGRLDCALSFAAGPLPREANVMTMSVLAWLRKATGGVRVGT